MTAAPYKRCCCVSATMRVCARTATENLCATIARDCAEMYEGQSRIEALVDSYQNTTAKCVFFSCRVNRH